MRTLSDMLSTWRGLTSTASIPRAALAQARQALDLAAAPDCGYAWGEADAAHLAGSPTCA